MILRSIPRQFLLTEYGSGFLVSLYVSYFFVEYFIVAARILTFFPSEDHFYFFFSDFP